MKIYYAHSQWEYGTPLEDYNLQIIRSAFPSAEIYNPSKFVDEIASEGEIMLSCFEKIEQSYLVVFSTLSGVVGRGVTQELLFAESAGKPIYQIYDGKVHLQQEVKIYPIDGEEASGRTFGVVRR